MTRLSLALCLLPMPAAALPLDCLIEPRSIIEIAATEEGRVDEVLVSRGDRVSAGDPLIRLDDEVQRLQLSLAETRRDSDLEVRAGQTRLALRQQELDRARQLAERNVGAETTVEQAEIEVALSEIAIEEAELARNLAEIQSAQAAALLERRQITSPRDGIVVSVETGPGEFASRQAVLLQLAEIDPLYVEVFVPPTYFERIGLGDRFVVTQSSPLDGSYEATVTVIDQVFDAASNTFGVRLTLPNPDARIPAGTRCTVDFDTPVQDP